MLRQTDSRQAHHEKFIVIDYAVAFIGGIDLCFGRWDVNQHPLADVHPAGLRDDIFPGQEFNNNRIMDFQGVQDWQSNEVSKADYGRMPWHDVAMGLMGDCVFDIAEHFVLRWNFIKRDKYKRNHDVDWLLMEGRTGENEDIIAVQRPKYPCGEYIQHPLTPLSSKPRGDVGTVRAQIVRSSDDWSSGILNEHSIQNAYCETIRNAQHFVYIENQFFSKPAFLERACNLANVHSHRYWRPAASNFQHDWPGYCRCVCESRQGRPQVPRHYCHPRDSRLRW